MDLTQLAVVSVLALTTVAVDQVSKAVAVHLVPAARTASTSWIRWELMYQPNAGIGRMTLPRNLTLLAAGGAVAAALGLVGWVGPLPVLSLLGLGLAVGGGVGNAVDLLVRDRIVDFIAIGRWPTFNVADVALCVGTALALFGWLG